jgi:hypothetical protein
VRSFEVGRLSRRVQGLTACEIGLMLDEAKTLLAELQRRMVESQIEEKVACARVCTRCLRPQPIRDRRTRTLQTLFGTVRVGAPRIRLCGCIDTAPFDEVSFSPLADLLPDRCTPELRRLQAELGARHSFREAARLLATFLPCSRPNHASVRNRLHRIAAAMESAEISSLPPSHGSSRANAGSEDEIVVLIDGAHIRAVPGHQTRHLDVTVGKVEVPGRKPRRFALAPLAADRPLAQIRAALTEQGWTGEQPVTVISDGEAALPELVRRATRIDIRHILDWWHISMRVRHAEQALAGVYALEPIHRGGLDMVEYGISRLRHLIWNGYHQEARRELFDLQHLAHETVYLNGERLRPAVSRFRVRCEELRSYLENNEAALIDYSRRYHSGQPVSTSRAEGCVDEIANTRMAKRRRMRWSPRGAHRVAVVRAAVLDGRLSSHAHRRAA